MTLVIKDKGGSDLKPAPAGIHVATCNMVVDVGTQSDGKFKPRQKVWVRWEIPGERVTWEKDGKTFEGPAQIGRFYTASLSQKAKLRADLENWRGKAFTAEELAGFDLFNILGTACQISIQHVPGDGGRVFANVVGVMGMPRGMPRPKPEKPLIKWSPADPSQFGELPQWLQQRISESQGQDPREMVSKASGDEDFDDDIPF